MVLVRVVKWWGGGMLHMALKEGGGRAAGRVGEGSGKRARSFPSFNVKLSRLNLIF